MSDWDKFCLAYYGWCGEILFTNDPTMMRYYFDCVMAIMARRNNPNW